MFLVKLFLKSFRRRRLFEKKQHPKLFFFYQWFVFEQFPRNGKTLDSWRIFQNIQYLQAASRKQSPQKKHRMITISYTDACWNETSQKTERPFGMSKYSTAWNNKFLAVFTRSHQKTSPLFENTATFQNCFIPSSMQGIPRTIPDNDMNFGIP